MSEKRFGEGWALPVIGVATGGNAKAHYYSEGFHGQSLCGRYVLLGGEREDDNHNSPDNCTACMRKLAKAHPEKGVKVTPRFRAVIVDAVKSEDEWTTYLRSGESVTFEGSPEHSQRMTGQGGAILVKKGRKLYSVKARNVRLGKELSA